MHTSKNIQNSFDACFAANFASVPALVDGTAVAEIIVEDDKGGLSDDKGGMIWGG